MKTEEGKRRVLLAQKRKGQIAEDADEPHGTEVMEDIPDAEEEMRGPDAAGQPPPDRIDPTGRSGQGGDEAGRVDPVGRPDPMVSERFGPMDRPVQEAEGSRPESPTKRQRSGAIQGEKRKGDSIEKLAKEAERQAGFEIEGATSSSSGKPGRSTSIHFGDCKLGGGTCKQA